MNPTKSSPPITQQSIPPNHPGTAAGAPTTITQVATATLKEPKKVSAEERLTTFARILNIYDPNLTQKSIGFIHPNDLHNFSLLILKLSPAKKSTDKKVQDAWFQFYNAKFLILNDPEVDHKVFIDDCITSFKQFWQSCGTPEMEKEHGETLVNLLTTICEDVFPKQTVPLKQRQDLLRLNLLLIKDFVQQMRPLWTKISEELSQEVKFFGDTAKHPTMISNQEPTQDITVLRSYFELISNLLHRIQFYFSKPLPKLVYLCTKVEPNSSNLFSHVKALSASMRQCKEGIGKFTAQIIEETVNIESFQPIKGLGSIQGAQQTRKNYYITNMLKKNFCDRMVKSLTDFAIIYTSRFERGMNKSEFLKYVEEFKKLLIAAKESSTKRISNSVKNRKAIHHAFTSQPGFAHMISALHQMNPNPNDDRDLWLVGLQSAVNDAMDEYQKGFLAHFEKICRSRDRALEFFYPNIDIIIALIKHNLTWLLEKDSTKIVDKYTDVENPQIKDHTKGANTYHVLIAFINTLGAHFSRIAVDDNSYEKYLKGISHSTGDALKADTLMITHFKDVIEKTHFLQQSVNTLDNLFEVLRDIYRDIIEEQDKESQVIADTQMHRIEIEEMHEEAERAKLIAERNAKEKQPATPAKASDPAVAAPKKRSFAFAPKPATITAVPHNPLKFSSEIIKTLFEIRCFISEIYEFPQTAFIAPADVTEAFLEPSEIAKLQHLHSFDRFISSLEMLLLCKPEDEKIKPFLIQATLKAGHELLEQCLTSEYVKQFETLTHDLKILLNDLEIKLKEENFWANEASIYTKLQRYPANYKGRTIATTPMLLKHLHNPDSVPSKRFLDELPKWIDHAITIQVAVFSKSHPGNPNIERIKTCATNCFKSIQSAFKVAEEGCKFAHSQKDLDAIRAKEKLLNASIQTIETKLKDKTLLESVRKQLINIKHYLINFRSALLVIKRRTEPRFVYRNQDYLLEATRGFVEELGLHLASGDPDLMSMHKVSEYREKFDLGKGLPTHLEKVLDGVDVQKGIEYAHSHFNVHTKKSSHPMLKTNSALYAFSMESILMGEKTSASENEQKELVQRAINFADLILDLFKTHLK